MGNDEVTTTDRMDDVTLYHTFSGLKNKKGLKSSQLKTLLAIGGWKLGAVPFTALASTPESRQTFIASVIKFLHQYEFDGLDFDQEYPGSHGSTPQDKHLFSVLVQEICEGFEQNAKQVDKPRLMVTTAVAAGISNIQSGYEIPPPVSVSDDLSYNSSVCHLYLDYIHVMTYDLHGSWEGYTGENSPFYKNPTDTGSTAHLHVVSPRIDADADQRPCRKSRGDLGTKPTKIPQMSHLYNICTFLKYGATEAWEASEDVPYAYRGNEGLGYDDTRSFKIKTGTGSSSSGGSSGGNGFWAGKASGLYPVANNRNAFWHCPNRLTYQQNCPAGLVFDTSCDCCNWA
ncbi:Acidic mammalian chitinase [Pteropus alecto]|uniref:chitinase n=1 Tax=Pteropus alecto TaxID=9402 RepID=L5K3J9_PTEAL|nr:Acidic mammalian chitinase [Pteropus alecto]